MRLYLVFLRHQVNTRCLRAKISQYGNIILGRLSHTKLLVYANITFDTVALWFNRETWLPPQMILGFRVAQIFGFWKMSFLIQNPAILIVKDFLVFINIFHHIYDVKIYWLKKEIVMSEIMIPNLIKSARNLQCNNKTFFWSVQRLGRWRSVII